MDDPDPTPAPAAEPEAVPARVHPFKKTIFYAALKSVFKLSLDPLSAWAGENWWAVVLAAKRSPDICILLAIVCALMGYAAGHWDRSEVIALNKKNGYLNGQLAGQAELIKQLQNDRDEKDRYWQGQIQGLKSNTDEARREEDAKIVELITERDDAKNQLLQWQTLPGNISQMYNHLAGPLLSANRQPLDSLFNGFQAAVGMIQKDNAKSSLASARRILTTESADKILKYLDWANQGTRVRIRTLGMEDETRALAIQISGMFSDDGFTNVTSESPEVTGIPPSGVSVILPKKVDANLANAMSQLFTEIKQEPNIMKGETDGVTVNIGDVPR